MKIIIIGADHVGASIARILEVEQGNDITIVDTELRRKELDDLQNSLNIRTVVGEVCYPNVLTEAGADDAEEDEGRRERSAGADRRGLVRRWRRQGLRQRHARHPRSQDPTRGRRPRRRRWARGPGDDGGPPGGDRGQGPQGP